MEDAADALKIAFAVLIFSIGLAVFFNIASLAKNTSDTVFLSIDKANYYQYTTDDKVVENRIVTLKDIVPTIYRYVKENYGVTIIDKDGNLVARFDINTDSLAQGYINSTNQIYNSLKDQYKSNILNIFNRIYNACGKSAPEDIENDILKKLYSTTDPNIKYSTEWMTGTGENILKRIESDIYGVTYEQKKHNPICNGYGLYGKYNSQTLFKEYVLEIDESKYINGSGDYSNNLIDETVVTISGTKKMEIIYVEQ